MMRSSCVAPPSGASPGRGSSRRGVEARRVSDTFEARSVLRAALNARYDLKSYLHRNDITCLSYSPDGCLLAAGYGKPEGASGGVVLRAEKSRS